MNLRLHARRLWYAGRYAESMAVFGEIEAATRRLSHVSLPLSCANTIGCMGHLDGFIKRKILGRDLRTYILRTPMEQIVNVPFLDYWSEYIRIEIGPPDPMAGEWNWALPFGDCVEYVHRGIARAEQQWHAEGRAPLLKLKPGHRDLLESQKRAWGMGADDWFICLHVRSAAFHGDGASEDFRNSPIADYEPMIRETIRAGGWVIRLGDPSMPPLTVEHPRAIDYARRPEKSPEMDVALCASCRLFVGVSSGMYLVAHAFGTPICLVNFPLMAGVPWHPEMLFIPPRYIWRDTGRDVTLEEFLSGDLIYADHGPLQEKAGIALERNRPDEIASVVAEALYHDHYSAARRDRAPAIQLFDKLKAEYDTQMGGKLGLHYAIEHRSRLMSETSFVRPLAVALDH